VALLGSLAGDRNAVGLKHHTTLDDSSGATLGLHASAEPKYKLGAHCANIGYKLVIFIGFQGSCGAQFGAGEPPQARAPREFWPETGNIWPGGDPTLRMGEPGLYE
jgi:hypothetical protein